MLDGTVRKVVIVITGAFLDLLGIGCFSLYVADDLVVVLFEETSIVLVD